MTGDRTDSRALPPRGRNRAPGLAWRAVAVLAAGVALAIPVARADASEIDTLGERIAAAEARARALGADVERSVVALADARASSAGAANREAALTETLAQGQQRAGELATQVRGAQERLAAARARLGRALGILSARLVAIYKSNGPDGAGVLLAADGFDDLSTRASLLGRIQAADTALADRVRALRFAVATELGEAEAAKQRVDRHNERVEAARDEIAAAREAAEAEAARLAAARAEQGAALRAIGEKMGVWSARIDELEAQVDPVPPPGGAAGCCPYNGWAIPEAIVICESGGNFSALNPSSGAGGAYQILPSTWAAYGGSGEPDRASPASQHAIAAQIWADSGPSAWVCAG